MAMLSDCIRVYDVDFPPSFLDDLVQEFGSTFNHALVQGEKDYGINLNVRNCFDARITNQTEKQRMYDNVIFKQVASILEQYAKNYSRLNIINDTGYSILKYETGGFYTEHVDMSKEHERLLSISIQLNDDFEGGEFSFFNDSYKIQLKKNQAICFPSNFLFPHAINRVTRGTRYSIVTWAN